MGKQGPCCHCGISTTPLWRNGPPEKPVLCNACGSRWKTKGTLLNYMPMHSGGFGANTEASADLKWSRGRKGSHKHGEQRSHKRKEPCGVVREAGKLRADQSFSKVHEEEAVFRSLCSGSAMSNSEGSVRRSSSLTRDLPVFGPPWDAPIPSKKRSVTLRLRTPTERLTRSLVSLFVDPAPPVPSPPTEALLVEYNKPSLVALEIGLGSVFVRQPVSTAQESESETTSFLTDSMGSEPFNVLGHSELAGGTPLVNGSDNGSALRGKEKAKQIPRSHEAGHSHNEKNVIPNKALLENFPYSKRDVLQSVQSPLAFLEMKDIVNFDTFTGLLTEQEQGQLMQFLSSADVAGIPESLKCMFSSAQFEGALANFQHLLSEGVFDSSEQGGLSPCVLQHFQQLRSVTDLTGSGWMDRCSQLQNRIKRRGSVDCSKGMQNKESSKDKLKGPSFSGAATSACSGFYGAKQLHARPYDRVEEDIKAMKTNSFTGTTSSALPSILQNANPPRHGLIRKSETGNSSGEVTEMEALAKIEGTCFLSNSPFLSTGDRGPPIIGEEYLNMEGMDSGEADSLLFDVPNPMSFQQSELLQQPSWTKTKSMKDEEIDATQVESGGLIMSNTWHTDTSPAEWSRFWNSSCVGPAQVLPNGTVLNPGQMLL